MIPLRFPASVPGRALAAAAFAAAGVGLGPLPAAAMTDVQVVETDSGLTAWLVEEHAIPMVAIEIMFETGASLDPADKQGATHFMSAMLDEGAGELDSAAFSKQADTLALRYSFDAGRDYFTVSAKMLTENLDEAAALLRSALTEPRFDDEPLERVRGQILSGLRGRATDPNDMVGDALRASVYGAADPYGRVTEGTAETVAALTAADLRAAKDRALNRSRVHIGVVGDIDAARLKPLLDDLLAGLPDGALDRPGPAEAKIDGSVHVIDFDTPQAVARLVGPGILRDDPDFIPAYVMNHILGGGGFSSRLTEEVREKRGLTYSVWSYLAPFERSGLLLAGVSSDNGRIGQAVEVIKDEWRRFAEEGATQEELDEARRYLTGAYPLRFDSNGKIAGQLAGLMSQGFSPAYIAERNDLIDAVTLEDVNRVAKRLLRPEALDVFVVGRPEGMSATN